MVIIFNYLTLEIRFRNITVTYTSPGYNHEVAVKYFFSATLIIYYHDVQI